VEALGRTAPGGLYQLTWFEFANGLSGGLHLTVCDGQDDSHRSGRRDVYPTGQIRRRTDHWAISGR